MTDEQRKIWDDGMTYLLDWVAELGKATANPSSVDRLSRTELISLALSSALQADAASAFEIAAGLVEDHNYHNLAERIRNRNNNTW